MDDERELRISSAIYVTIELAKVIMFTMLANGLGSLIGIEATCTGTGQEGYSSFLPDH